MVSTDHAHCGGCGHFCAPSEVCGLGTCVAGCQPPLLSCTNGTSCADPRVDPDNCGGCGHVCPAVPNARRLCEAGLCGRTVCNPGTVDCNGALLDGCEAVLATDPANCGGCGQACLPGRSCVAGVCQ